MREHPEVHDRPELRRPLRQPGRARRRPRDAHGPAGRLVARCALPRHQPVGDGGRAGVPARSAARRVPGRPVQRTPASSTAACRATTAGSFTGADRARKCRCRCRAAALEQPVGGAGRGARRHGAGDPAVVRGARVGGRRHRASRCSPTTAAGAGDPRGVPVAEAGAVEGDAASSPSCSRRWPASGGARRCERAGTLRRDRRGIERIRPFSGALPRPGRGVRPHGENTSAVDALSPHHSGL